MKALTEIAGLALLGQGIMFMLIAVAGSDPEKNVFYSIVKIITTPLLKATRFIAPRFILDQHIGLLAVFLVGVLWLLFTAIKVRLIFQAAG